MGSATNLVNFRYRVSINGDAAILIELGDECHVSILGGGSKVCLQIHFGDVPWESSSSPCSWAEILSFSGDAVERVVKTDFFWREGFSLRSNCSMSVFLGTTKKFRKMR